MKKPHENRDRVRRALRLFEKGAVTDAVVLLNRSQARVELQSGKLDEATLRALEDQTASTAIAAYVVLKDDTRLFSLAERCMDQQRYEQAVDALTNVAVIPGKHSDFLMRLLKAGAHREVLRLLKFVYPNARIQELSKLNGGTQYDFFRQLIRNNLLSSFDSTQGSDGVMDSDVANQLLILEYTQDVELVGEFESQCIAAGKKEWAYVASALLLKLARKKTEERPTSFTRKIEAAALAIDQKQWIVAAEMLLSVLEQHDVPETTRSLIEKLFAQLPRNEEED